MEHSIKERCHVNTNIYVDTFVGIKCIDGDTDNQEQRQQ